MGTEEREKSGVPETAESIESNGITHVIERAEKEAEEKGKKEKPRKTRRGLRTFLRILQHAALAVTVLSLIVTVACGTVRFEGMNAGGSFTDLIFHMESGKEFEDSAVFQRILGYTAADLIRFGVVSSQMETEGAFDGEKLVDVTAYNHRNEGISGDYVTAVYRLEDLLKWQKYGFEMTVEEMTEAEAEAFLAKTTQVVSSRPKAAAGGELSVKYEVIESDSGFVKDYQPASALGDHTEEREEPEIVVINPYEEEALYAYSVLVNRYQTAEGKNLEDYVSDWEQYYTLCDQVRTAAQSLSYNYEEYLDGEEYFKKENSNVRFLIERAAEESRQYYSNMAADSGDRSETLRWMDYLSGGGDVRQPKMPYLYYSPADMTYRTNTTIEESTMRQILQQYAYAYPEDVRIWISVDTAYPAMDAFRQGKEYLPNLWQWALTALLAGILYLALFVWQTMMSGRAYDEAGNKYTELGTFDRIPTEAALLLAAGVFLLTGWVCVVAAGIAGIDPTDLTFYREAVRQDWFIATVLIGVFAADVIFTFFFYSLVRRIKARTLYANSYLRRLIGSLKEFVWKVYDNGGVVLRTWVPYGIFLLFNLLMSFIAVRVNGGGADVLLILLTCAVDAAVGVMFYRDAKERQGIVEGIETIAGGHVEHQIDTEGLHGDNKALALSVNSIGKGIQEAVEISMKDERMKADLITNVSHDIKTPLTSIINYVDLLKREQVGSEKARDYIRVLDEKSQRLKQLTDDLVEASKITSGTISLQFERINLTELMNQTIGEFSEKFEEKGLVTVMNVNTANVVVEADSRRIWRVMENLFNNIYKYAMPGTRVYVSMDQYGKEERVQVSIKNISENYLNCKPEELTERFIRGDESRTTEGSGLGLSIAKNLTLAQGGTFEIELDGDLFKVFLTFPMQ
ncbi:MAG: HAMP domain-containing histidine kinase [Bacteroidales bacterium]|nr:HAMP domain-containing histidine kinase [Bacteroidales bacterium]MCM1416417.1 HAMP domain-containing histidine kinase [bacterium]MCM1424052.1 HAMP domain-containing histidine kinase [bacterium]